MLFLKLPYQQETTVKIGSKDDPWDREVDPLADLEAAIEMVSRGSSRPPQSSLDNFRQGIQQLYLLGWSSEQVVGLVKELADEKDS
jgi:hypothetical protein